MTITVIEGDIAELAYHEADGKAFIRIKVQGADHRVNVYVPRLQATGLALGQRVKLTLEAEVKP